MNKKKHKKARKPTMARHTTGLPVTINCNSVDAEGKSDFPAEWKRNEFVIARSLYTQGDREWINVRGGVHVDADPDNPQQPKTTMDSWAIMSATVAKMVLRWELMRDIVSTDEQGNSAPVYDANGEPLQEPFALPDGLEQRLAAVRALHEEDVAYIFNKITEAAPRPKTAEQQQNFTSTATGPSLAPSVAPSVSPQA